jgi:hypothetical protein
MSYAEKATGSFIDLTNVPARTLTGSDQRPVNHQPLKFSHYAKVPDHVTRAGACAAKL